MTWAIFHVGYVGLGPAFAAEAAAMRMYITTT